MESAMLEQLIRDYRTYAAAHGEPNDGTPDWAERVNQAADHMLLIARAVGASGSHAIARFGELIHAEDPHLSEWAAHHLLDFMEPPAELRDAALSVIERAAEASTPAGFEEKLWLENWRGESQDE
jgi:hypothetical protein